MDAVLMGLMQKINKKNDAFLFFWSLGLFVS
jgi:hypothetical protein